MSSTGRRAVGARTARWRVGVVVGAWAFAVCAPVADADPARPTDDRSSVTAITPATPAIDVDVVGGDSFLELRARPGHAVTVLGYEGEPYLRILPDGVTEVNRRSPAVGINRSRGGGDPDVDADASAPPDWRPLPAAERAGPSTLLWHDHRTHWMGGSAAPDLGPDGLVQDWHVGLLVDGVPVDVAGSLHRHRAPSRWWWSTSVLALVVLLAPALTTVAVATATTAAVLLALTGIDLGALPAPARPAYTPLAMLGFAVVAAAAAVVARRRWWAAPLVAGAGVASMLGAWMLRGAATHRFVPGPTPDRLVAVAVVVVGAVGVLALARGVLTSALGDEADRARHRG